MYSCEAVLKSLALVDHAGHAVELFDAPFVGACDTGGEKRLLCVEDILEFIHWGSPEHGYKALALMALMAVLSQ
jgi:hypothetical protein